MHTNRLAAAAVAAAATFAAPAAAHAATYSQAVLADGPVAYYGLDEATGATVAADGAAAHLYPGAFLKPAVRTAAPFAAAGTAVSLDAGAAIHADIPRATGSVELWVKPVRVKRGQQQGLVAHSGWALGIGAKRKLTFVSGTASLNTRITLPAAAWTMLDVAWGGGRVKVYVNGNLTRDLAAATPADTGRFELGGTGLGAFGGAFTGAMDEVALFPGQIAATAVKAHFAASGMPVNTVVPQITGTAKVGSALTLTAGTWSGAASLTHQWQRCDAADCDDIPGATGSSYVPVKGDAGQTLHVVETAANAWGTTTVVTDDTAAVEDAGAGSSTGGGTTGGGTTSGGTATTGGTTPSGGTSTGGSPDAGGVAGVSASQPGCLKLVKGARRTKVARLGTVALRVAKSRCVRAGSPLRLSFLKKRTTKLASVHYRVDRKVLAASGAHRRYGAKVTRLKAGRHVLRVTIAPAHGRAKTVKVALRVAR